MIETAVVGVAGGLLGLLLTAGGLFAARSFLTSEFRLVTRLDAWDTAATVLFAVLATIAAGSYPTWRAVRVQPGWQLKAP